MDSNYFCLVTTNNIFSPTWPTHGLYRICRGHLPYSETTVCLIIRSPVFTTRSQECNYRTGRASIIWAAVPDSWRQPLQKIPISFYSQANTGWTVYKCLVFYFLYNGHGKIDKYWVLTMCFHKYGSHIVYKRLPSDFSISYTDISIFSRFFQLKVDKK